MDLGGRGRVTPHGKGRVLRVGWLNRDEENVATKNERNAMHLLISPVLANATGIGDGTAGLLLLIIVLVLPLRG
jgi:hypothetical protein